MIIDVSLILIFFISLWIGWAMRIYLDWFRVLWIILFAVLIWIILPFFMTFVAHSSTHFSVTFYYTFGIMMAVLIFLCFLMLFRTKRASSSFVRRLMGSFALAFISCYSLLVVFYTMAAYGWVDIEQSFVFSKMPEWVLNLLN